MRKHLGTILKIGITLLALLYVSTRVDFADIGQRLLQAKPGWVVMGFVLVNSSLVVRAFRWRLLLQGIGAPIKFGRLVSLYFAANFFNSVLPSGFSGDVVRAVEAAQDVPAETAAGTVLVDRATGLLALFMIGLAALPFRPDNFSQTLFWQTTAVCLIGLIGGFAVLEGRLVHLFGRWVPARLRPAWAKVAGVITAVQACGWTAVWQAIGVSILFNFMQISWFAAAGLALGYQVPFSHYILVIPFLSIAILLPSIGGLGIRESLAPALFASAGLVGEQAVALTLLVFAIERLSGFLGAPIYILGTLRRSGSRQV
ncbi:lysylphosphatidylglycerol synthase transmembrane domain-containing protein [Candidatus Leptofilum sp.]|uniref:lysylphosphatidylglycerol synthase transmembrane domain-containing protein n=1 Tax=Candidatus Leptofilum sp. TaxID=3241576 RepID=UPI003B59F3BE